MDKLQPIIQQRFWILLVVCLGLATFGFFKGQAAMVSATQAREEALTKIKGEISKGAEPNQDYLTKLEHINKGYDGFINDSIKELFAAQKELMWWPDRVKELIPPVHRKEIIVDTRIKYAREYQNLIDELWTKVEPVVPKEIPGQRQQPVRGARPEKPVRVTWTQKVYCEKESLPQKFFDPKFVPPDAVWDAQEDIWFVERIFEAIRAINQPADSPLTAVVRKINQLTLRGGDGETGGGEADAMSSDGDSGDYRAQSMRMGGISGTSMGMQGGIGGAGMGTDFSAPVAFDPAEEFGSDAAPLEESSSDEESSGSFTPMMFSGSRMGGAGPDMPTLRWYKLDDAAPYRERAFYLSVIMQQSQIPDFMIALLDSPWPIRIVRFQMGPNPHFQENEGQSPGGMYGGSSLAGDDSRGMLGGGRRSGSSGMMGMAGAASPMASSRTGMGSSSASSMMSMGLGGRGGMQARQAGAGLAFINTPADPFAGALNSPDLVQVDIAGVITFYVETKDDGTAAVETPAVDSQSALPTEEPVTDEEGAAAEEQTAEPAAEAAPVDGEAAVDGEAPVEGEMPVDPAAEPAPIETSPVESAEPAGESPVGETPVPIDDGGAAPAEEPAPN